MKNTGAYVLPHLVLKFLTMMVGNKEHQLMMASNTKQFFADAAAVKKAKIAQKYASQFSKLAQELSQVTNKTQENSQQAFDPAASNDLMQAYQDNAAARNLLTSQQTAEESQLDAETQAKERPLDTQIELMETSTKALRADVENWQKITDNAAKGGSSS